MIHAPAARVPKESGADILPGFGDRVVWVAAQESLDGGGQDARATIPGASLRLEGIMECVPWRGKRRADGKPSKRGDPARCFSDFSGVVCHHPRNFRR
jgi:hypothetical protein